MSGITLMYIPSEHIVRYITDHPIDWYNKRYAERNGPGDRAGITPTPAVEEFLHLLIARRELFTQHDYMCHCWEQWREWIAPKSSEQKIGVKAKLYRNFYPAMIDSLHVWAMLVETGMFDSCVLNSTEDAIGKTDLIVTCGAREIRLALIGPTDSALSDRQYKMVYRNNGERDTTCVEVVLSKEYPMHPGRKRWFRKQDIMQAILSPSPAPRILKDITVPYHALAESN